MSYYKVDGVATVLHGDCLHELRTLPDNSVHAVVTDPPYGLSNTNPSQVADAITRWVSGEREFLPSGRGFMGNEWDAFVPPVAVWDECLRVLKPGGHLLAFAGSRTHDLMTLSIRLAGFEIRDSVAWMYGSGMPKSMNISRAIDMGRGKNRERQLEFTAWMRSTGISADTINEATGTNMASHYLTDKSQPAIATADLFDLLRPHLPEVPEHIERLVAERTGIEWTDYVKREVVGVKERAMAGWKMDGTTEFVDREITAPHSEEAKQWEGWGTALKPSHEPVVVALKPHVISGILDGIGSELTRLEDECRRSVSVAERSSAPTPADSPEARTDTAPDSAATPHEDGQEPTTPTGAAVGSSAQTATSWSGEETPTPSSTVSSWRNCWAELCELTSTSTTSTTTGPTTDLQTLWSSISSLTVTSTPDSPTPALTSGSTASAVDSLFAATVLRLRATLALSATESATASTPQVPQGAGGRSSFEPIILARKPLEGTFAENVLKYGTGAINIDATRIGNDTVGWGGKAAGGQTWTDDNNGLGKNSAPRPVEGRWPANLVLDEDQAAELDKQSGNVKGAVSNGKKAGTGYDGGFGGMPQVAGYADFGGASRFFYVAKPDHKERPKAGGVQHPTVKPLSLMQWLIRLVVPEGGTVLDPFAGSGTTLEAAVRERVQSIGIEREDDYLPLIKQRLERAVAVKDELTGFAAPPPKPKSDDQTALF